MNTKYFKTLTKSIVVVFYSDIRLKSSSSRQWIQRQLNDPYVKRSKLENWRCRSAYKLLEIDDKYNILKPGHLVIDVGAAPGSWTQVSVDRVNANGLGKGKPIGKVISIDLLPISPIPGALLIENSDFSSNDCLNKILKHMERRKADVILSDMAPNASGIKSHDGSKLVSLALKVLQFSTNHLSQDGTVLIKLWQGGICEDISIQAVMEKLFSSVKVVKPHASRSDSREIYYLCRKFHRT